MIVLVRYYRYLSEIGRETSGECGGAPRFAGVVLRLSSNIMGDLLTKESAICCNTFNSFFALFCCPSHVGLICSRMFCGNDFIGDCWYCIQLSCDLYEYWIKRLVRSGSRATGSPASRPGRIPIGPFERLMNAEFQKISTTFSGWDFPRPVLTTLYSNFSTLMNERTLHIPF